MMNENLINIGSSNIKDLSFTKIERVDSTIKIWLVDPTYTQQQISSEAIPSPIGGIAVNTEALLNLESDIKIFKYPEKLIESLQINGFPDVIGFSNYIWNFQLSYSIATVIKEINPQTIIIMGGPNYPISSNEKELFLRKYSNVDFYVSGEGELAFPNLISILIKNNLEKKSLKFDIPSIQFIDDDGKAHVSEPIERISDLSEIPSPYLLGKLDKFFDGKLQPTIQTTRGCPFACTFCVEGEQYYSKVSRTNLTKIDAELNYVGRKMNEVKKLGGRNDLWIVDSNFGMYSQDLDTCKIISQCQEKYGWPENIQCDTGKNNKARVLNAAKLVNGAIRLSGAVQSLDKQVLVNVKRSNISSDALMQMAVEAAEIDTSTKSDLILGLPGESIKTHFDSIKTIMDAGFNYLQTNQLMMLPGTELSDQITRNKFGMKTKFRVLPRCFGHYEIMNKKVIAAEVEEICVSNDSLTFEDYIQCRKMHLLTHIFYNDGLFSTALKFLKDLNISVFRLLEIMYSRNMPELLKELFNKFEEDTRNELWDDEEKLLQFIEKPGTIEKYISGDIGYNLLFVYKAIAMNKYIIELKNFVMDSMKEILKENNKNTEENLNFVSEILEFDLCCCSNIFHDKNKNPKRKFNFDIQHFQEIKNFTNITDIKLTEPREIEFLLNSDQENIIERSIKLYSDDDLGISRILTKVFFKKLLRSPA